MIVLRPHDSSWASQFAAARTEMMAACKHLMLDVHHVGSTSIAGIVAKPIIDMMPILARHEDGLACIAPMESIGYTYRGERASAAATCSCAAIRVRTMSMLSRTTILRSNATCCSAITCARIPRSALPMSG